MSCCTLSHGLRWLCIYYWPETNTLIRGVVFPILGIHMTWRTLCSYMQILCILTTRRWPVTRRWPQLVSCFSARHSSERQSGDATYDFVETCLWARWNRAFTDVGPTYACLLLMNWRLVEQVVKRHKRQLPTWCRVRNVKEIHVHGVYPVPSCRYHRTSINLFLKCDHN